MIDTNLYTDYPYYGAFTVDDRNFNPKKFNFKHLFWKHYDWLKEMDASGRARPCVLDNVQRVLLCNTIYLGYDGFECSQCGNENLLFRKCHSRLCTSCGVKNQKIFAAKAEAMCIDISHRHIVFTIPEEYRILFRKDRSALDLLFIAARNTICKVCNESLYRKEKRKRSKTGKIHNDKDNLYLFRNFKNQNIFGMIATIHTFGRSLIWNPHIHALVPELIYQPDKDQIKEFHHFDFKSLRLTWQYELNRLLYQHFGKSFRKLMNNSFIDQDKGFYVYAKTSKQEEDREDNQSTSQHVSGCVSYMMRYASRPAMAQSRVTEYNKETDEIEWFYDDHKTNERIIVKETGLELLKKIIIHIPDRHFRTVRYYGFYHPKEKNILDTVHEQLGQKHKINKDRQTRKQILQDKIKKLHFRTMCMDTYNRDVLRCSCGSLMEYVGSYNPLDRRSNGRQYREECINEMRELRIRRAGPPKRS